MTRPLEGMQAELSCWQNKLADLEAKYLEADLLSPYDRSFMLASLRLQERIIRENIAELCGRLEKSTA